MRIEWIVDIVAIFAVIGGVVTAFWAMRKWSIARRERRAEFLFQLLEKFMEDDNIRSVIYAADHSQDVHTVPEATKDKALTYLSYVCYLKSTGVISNEEYMFFDYIVKRVVGKVQGYLTFIEDFSKSQGCHSPFKYLIGDKGKEKMGETMNTVVKMAVIAVGSATLLAGCGKDTSDCGSPDNIVKTNDNSVTANVLNGCSADNPVKTNDNTVTENTLGSGSPDDVVKAFVTCLKSCDIAGARKYCIGKMRADILKIGAIKDDPDVKEFLENSGILGSAIIDGNKAEVPLILGGDERTVTLIKVDGCWKVKDEKATE